MIDIHLSQYDDRSGANTSAGSSKLSKILKSIIILLIKFVFFALMFALFLFFLFFQFILLFDSRDYLNNNFEASLARRFWCCRIRCCSIRCCQRESCSLSNALCDEVSIYHHISNFPLHKLGFLIISSRNE